MNYTNLALYWEGGIAEMFGPRVTLFAMYSNFFFVLTKRNTIKITSPKKIKKKDAIQTIIQCQKRVLCTL